MQHDPDYEPGDTKGRVAKAERESYQAREAIRYLLRLVPQWAEEVPPGLCPTMYGTASQEGDERVKARVDAIRAFVDEGTPLDPTSLWPGAEQREAELEEDK